MLVIDFEVLGPVGDALLTTATAGPCEGFDVPGGMSPDSQGIEDRRRVADCHEVRRASIPVPLTRGLGNRLIEPMPAELGASGQARLGGRHDGLLRHSCHEG